MRKPISINNEEYYFQVTTYQNNDRLAILLYDKDGDLHSDITINLSDIPICDIDEGFINGDFQTCSPHILKELKSKGIIQDSFGIIPYNYGNYEYVKFDLDKLKEYDFVGISKLLDIKINI